MRQHYTRLTLTVLLCAYAIAGYAQSQSGSLTASGDTVSASLVNIPSVVIQLTGTWNGGPVFEVSADDGSNWIQATVTPMTPTSSAGGRSTTQTGANGVFVLANPGYTAVRVRAASWTSGTATVAITRGFAGTLFASPPTAVTSITTAPVASLPLPLCNAILRSNCQPKGF